ncbi:MAG TPA: adenylate kinase [Thermoanaerobaculia bacterium]|nr:adenylate kinase [Thermoanaerobaculia bacterium]
MSARRIVLLGPPGCGKGTQAALLSGALAVPAISTGEMLRDAVARGSELGRQVEAILASGRLVDDETMAGVVAERLDREDARLGFLLDGYPRTLSQAETLAGILDGQGSKLDAVLLFEVPEGVLVARALARRRADDNEAVIRERLRVYRSQTAPLIGRYEDEGLLRAIDGNQSVEAVTAALTAALGG